MDVVDGCEVQGGAKSCMEICKGGYRPIVSADISVMTYQYRHIGYQQNSTDMPTLPVRVGFHNFCATENTEGIHFPGDHPPGVIDTSSLKLIIKNHPPPRHNSSYLLVIR